MANAIDQLRWKGVPEDQLWSQQHTSSGAQL